MIKNKILAWGLSASLLSALILAAGCAPTAGTSPTPGASSSTGFDWTFIIFIVVIIAIFYFFMIRPQSNRRKQQQQLMAELKLGDQVVTSGGIYGVIDSMDEETIVLKVESGAKIRVARQSVAGKRPSG